MPSFETEKETQFWPDATNTAKVKKNGCNLFRQK